MENSFYFSLCIIVLLLAISIYYYRAYKKYKGLYLDGNTQKKAEQNTIETKPPKIVNEHLKKIADECEANLPLESRGMVKLFVDYEKRDQLAALQIGEVRINLWRNGKTQSLFDVAQVREALEKARDGHPGTGRYIPVPREVQFVIKHLNVINIYLEAFGLEQISTEDEFWCVDTETGWNSGWKRFDWSIDTAYEELSDKFKVWTLSGYQREPSNETAKLFLLVKGWDHLFVEV